jgi:DNA-binding NarL/FixJ family response regulator
MVFPVVFRKKQLVKISAISNYSIAFFLELYRMNTSVAIVEDNSSIREAMELIVQLSSKYRLVGSFINGEEALRFLPALKPDVVLMDINLGGIDGIACVRQLKAIHPHMLFMICTVLEEDEKIFDALQAGANGYILKKTAPADMLTAIDELCNGGAPMSSQIARKLVQFFRQPGVVSVQKRDSEVIDELTKRETQVLEMLSQGLMYKEIGDELSISTETVKKHVYRIYDKLHVNNRTEALNKYYGR